MSNDPRVARARERQRAMAAHPSNYQRDDQPGIIARLLADEAPPLEPFEEAASEVYFELLELLVSKQADYGPEAISRSPGGALNGINVRMHDKLSRVVNLTRGTVPAHESLRDTYRDLANYAVIAVMVLDRTWPK